VKERIRKYKEPFLKYDLKDILNLIDVYTISILGLYTLLAIIFFKIIVDAKSYIFINLFVITSIITLATIVEKFNAGLLFKIVRYLYIVPLVFYVYSQTQIYVRIINPNDLDWLLIKWDYEIFGVHPTEILGQLSNPWLTEILQMSYMLFFLMPLAVGFELFIKKRYADYVTFTRTIAFSFFASYLLYFVMPAVGPRFTLHDFMLLDVELPGVFLTEFMREIVNIGGGIRSSISLEPLEAVSRDCMPSGHTWITLVNIWLAHKYRSISRYWIYFFGTGLIFATVYLRYHYVVDILAGIALAGLTIWLEPKIREMLRRAGFKLA